MKNIFVLIGLVTFTGGSFAQVGTTKPGTFDEQFSYAVGYDVTKSLLELHASLDKAWMMQGIVDALGDSTRPLLTKQEIELVFQEFQKRTQAEGDKTREAVANANRLLGEKFIREQMATNVNMKKTSSGLVYLPIEVGSGKNPTAESTVTVTYHGETINGTLFDEALDPITFKLTEVIPGWTEGLQLMKKGGKYKFIIPAELAYGNEGMEGTVIEPGSTLVFVVELIKFTTPKKK